VRRAPRPCRTRRLARFPASPRPIAAGRGLIAAGFADPGRAPNYWKSYPADQFDDAAIARELLTILHEVYGYAGLPKLKVKTE
jgi:hypothetical protein